MVISQIRGIFQRHRQSQEVGEFIPQEQAAGKPGMAAGTFRTKGDKNCAGISPRRSAAHRRGTVCSGFGGTAAAADRGGEDFAAPGDANAGSDGAGEVAGPGKRWIGRLGKFSAAAAAGGCRAAFASGARTGEVLAPGPPFPCRPSGFSRQSPGLRPGVPGSYDSAAIFNHPPAAP